MAISFILSALAALPMARELWFAAVELMPNAIAKLPLAIVLKPEPAASPMATA